MKFQIFASFSIFGDWSTLATIFEKSLSLIGIEHLCKFENFFDWSKNLEISVKIKITVVQWCWRKLNLLCLAQKSERIHVNIYDLIWIRNFGNSRLFINLYKFNLFSHAAHEIHQSSPTLPQPTPSQLTSSPSTTKTTTKL